MFKYFVAAAFLLMTPSALLAAPENFHAGTAIPQYGKVASVEGRVPLPAGASFRVAYDVAVGGEKGAVNRRLESAARFINMHVEAGVPLENIEIAIVVHGTAALDVTNDARYGGANANAGLIAALQKAGVKVILCGQSAQSRDVAPKDMLPGVELYLSAMTAHALLQQQGYTLNPF